MKAHWRLAPAIACALMLHLFTGGTQVALVGRRSQWLVTGVLALVAVAVLAAACSRTGLRVADAPPVDDAGSCPVDLCKDLHADCGQVDDSVCGKAFCGKCA